MVTNGASALQHDKTDTVAVACFAAMPLVAKGSVILLALIVAAMFLWERREPDRA